MSKDTNKIFYSTKTYEHSVGLSCCFRQWRASHSHCQYLHGYALQVKLVFKADGLDDRNWVVDFGGLKKVKQWLQDTFDHKTVVALDDPKITLFRELAIAKIIDLVEVSDVGCEKFAEMIFDYVTAWVDNYVSSAYGAGLSPAEWRGAKLDSVEVCEHGGNSAICKSKE